MQYKRFGNMKLLWLLVASFLALCLHLSITEARPQILRIENPFQTPNILYLPAKNPFQTPNIPYLHAICMNEPKPGPWAPISPWTPPVNFLGFPHVCSFWNLVSPHYREKHSRRPHIEPKKRSDRKSRSHKNSRPDMIVDTTSRPDMITDVTADTTSRPDMITDVTADTTSRPDKISRRDVIADTTADTTTRTRAIPAPVAGNDLIEDCVQFNIAQKCVSLLNAKTISDQENVHYWVAVGDTWSVDCTLSCGSQEYHLFNAMPFKLMLPTSVANCILKSCKNATESLEQLKHGCVYGPNEATTMKCSKNCTGNDVTDEFEMVQTENMYCSQAIADKTKNADECKWECKDDDNSEIFVFMKKPEDDTIETTLVVTQKNIDGNVLYLYYLEVLSDALSNSSLLRCTLICSDNKTYDMYPKIPSYLPLRQSECENGNQCETVFTSYVDILQFGCIYAVKIKDNAGMFVSTPTCSVSCPPVNPLKSTNMAKWPIDKDVAEANVYCSGVIDNYLKKKSDKCTFNCINLVPTYEPERSYSGEIAVYHRPSAATTTTTITSTIAPAAPAPPDSNPASVEDNSDSVVTPAPTGSGTL